MNKFKAGDKVIYKNRECEIKYIYYGGRIVVAYEGYDFACEKELTPVIRENLTTHNDDKLKAEIDKLKAENRNLRYNIENMRELAHNITHLTVE